MQKKVGKYVLVQEIGKGQFGQVYRALDSESPTNQEYAVKVMSREKVEGNPQVNKLFKTEIDIMKKLNHPNLLGLHDYLETSSNYYVVVQYCKDGDLEKKIMKMGRLDEETAVFYLKQIMSGFMYLSKNKIMHRDFKLANIFLHDDVITIGDFGFAKAGVEVTTTKLGTPYNMAPEILYSNGKTPYTSKSDLWSVGVVFFQMLSGMLPFRARSMEELKKMVLHQSGSKLIFPSDISISEEARHLLCSMLQFDPSTRLSWTGFFNHALFIKHSGYQPKQVQQPRASFVPNGSTLNDYVEQTFVKQKEQVNQHKNIYEDAAVVANTDLEVGRLT